MKDGVKLILPGPVDEHILAAARQLHRSHDLAHATKTRFLRHRWVPLVEEVFASLAELDGQDSGDIIHYSAIDHAARQESRRHQ